MTNIDKTATVATKKPGRAGFTDTNKGVVAALQNIDGLTKFQKKIMVRKGYLAKVKGTPDGTAGRPPMVLVLTAKGKNLLNLSKNWKKTETVAPVTEDERVEVVAAEQVAA